jgi:peptidoglycan-associated lipoprotein
VIFVKVALNNLLPYRRNVMMKGFLVCAAAVLMMLLFVGCAQKQIAAPPEQPAAAAAPAETPKKAAEPVTEKQPMVKQEEMKSAEKELAAKVNDVYFAFDRYDLDDSAKTTVKGLAAMMGKMNAKVVVEGSCDERGTKEYNIALGEKRANAAKQYLISLGIPSAKIDTISYGKEKPICTESTEECWAKNRRDHFVLVEGGK